MPPPSLPAEDQPHLRLAIADQLGARLRARNLLNTHKLAVPFTPLGTMAIVEQWAPRSIPQAQLCGVRLG
ncbi:MAG: hypothetical protein ACK583_09860 [Cyanobacteriota bacterium]